MSSVYCLVFVRQCLYMMTYLILRLLQSPMIVLYFQASPSHDRITHFTSDSSDIQLKACGPSSMLRGPPIFFQIYKYIFTLFYTNLSEWWIIFTHQTCQAHSLPFNSTENHSNLKSINESISKTANMLSICLCLLI